MWDPDQYQRFSDERSRPFDDLTARIGAEDPRSVVDLGCGPGHLTADLARRWPGATVHGVDNSPEMIAAARHEEKPPRLTFEVADLRDWRPAAPVDVIVSNAVLQWVPDHLDLLPGWVDWLSPGGWLAFQLPGNFDQPPHRAIAEMAASPRWRPRLSTAGFNRQAGDLTAYLDVLAGAGCRVDAWETTYLHVLPGEDPVVEWVKGTALRPVLAQLDGAEGAEFLAEYRERMRLAYPARPCGTVLPFRRVFVVAHRPARSGG
jgi:trans-aconitate 2-methyltransferase